MTIRFPQLEAGSRARQARENTHLFYICRPPVTAGALRALQRFKRRMGVREGEVEGKRGSGNPRSSDTGVGYRATPGTGPGYREVGGRFAGACCCKVRYNLWAKT